MWECVHKELTNDEPCGNPWAYLTAQYRLSQDRHLKMWLRWHARYASHPGVSAGTTAHSTEALPSPETSQLLLILNMENLF